MTWPLVSPFITGTAVTKLQLDTLVDAINTAAIGINSRSAKRSTSVTLATGDNPVGGYPDSGTFNTGSITYASGIYTAQSTGVFQWGATVDVSSGGSAGARVSVQALVNGAPVPDGRSDVMVGASLEQYRTAGAPILLNTGDTVQLNINATSGASGMTAFPRLFWLHQIV